MRLTTATYWRPSGKNIHRTRKANDEDEWGVKPDEGFKVTLDEEETRQFLLAQRARFAAEVAAANQPGNSAKIKPGAEADEVSEGDQEPFVDRQLDKAVEYILEHINQPIDSAAEKAVAWNASSS